MTYKSDQKNDILIDYQTGETKRIKHLNQVRIDRGGWNSTPGGWNKSGKKGRMEKESKMLTITGRRLWKQKCNEYKSMTQNEL